METESRDYLEMTFKSINCFANDGRLLVNELRDLLIIAERDGVVDDNEKRVLANIFARLNPSELSGRMMDQIDSIRDEYDI